MPIPSELDPPLFWFVLSSHFCHARRKLAVILIMNKIVLFTILCLPTFCFASTRVIEGQWEIESTKVGSCSAILQDKNSSSYIRIRSVDNADDNGDQYLDFSDSAWSLSQRSGITIKKGSNPIMSFPANPAGYAFHPTPLKPNLLSYFSIQSTTEGVLDYFRKNQKVSISFDDVNTTWIVKSTITDDDFKQILQCVTNSNVELRNNQAILSPR